MIQTIDFKTQEKGWCTVELIDSFGSDSTICESARVSYTHKGKRNKRTDGELIKYLLESGHFSPFEMAELRFALHIPIYVARQLMRHRTANVAEKSMRYTVSNECEYFEPNEGNAAAYFMNSQNKDAYTLYEQLISHNDHSYKGIKRLAREDARKILPVCAITDIVFKTDVRNFFNVMIQRLSPHAQYETRFIAFLMWEHFYGSDKPFRLTSSCMLHLLPDPCRETITMFNRKLKLHEFV